jgi:hypothetical protein
MPHSWHKDDKYKSRNTSDSDFSYDTPTRHKNASAPKGGETQAPKTAKPSSRAGSKEAPPSRTKKAAPEDTAGTRSAKRGGALDSSKKNAKASKAY